MFPCIVRKIHALKILRPALADGHASSRPCNLRRHTLIIRILLFCRVEDVHTTCKVVPWDRPYYSRYRRGTRIFSSSSSFFSSFTLISYSFSFFFFNFSRSLDRTTLPHATSTRLSRDFRSVDISTSGTRLFKLI